ncbi:MAG: YdcF family protein [Chloroflexota bacterium]
MQPRSLGRDLLRLAVLGCFGVIVVAGYATFRVWAQGQRDDRRAADAIVVMGAAQYDGRPSPLFAARLDHAIGLFREGLARRLVLTGGRADGDRTTEAATARTYVLARGVPAGAILMEDQSRTTLESIHAVGGLLRANGMSAAIFVSDRPHMLRVLRMATDDGMRAWGSPTETSPIERDLVGRLDATLHELGALAQYFLVGNAS